jgi:hypothetical protein
MPQIDARSSSDPEPLELIGKPAEKRLHRRRIVETIAGERWPRLPGHQDANTRMATESTASSGLATIGVRVPS